MLRPEVRKSAACVAALLADSFVEFGSSGRVYDKREAVEGLSEECRVRLTLSEFSAFQLAPDVVLVTYRAVQQGDASEPPVHSLRSSLWKFADGRWQMVFHQGTPAKKL